MRLNPKRGWFAAFTALFAVCAAYVFWGTWSTGMAPVMPDCATFYPPDWFRRWVVGWLENGKFAPHDLKNFIGTPFFWQELQYALALYCAGLGLAYFLRGRGLGRLAAYGAGLLLAFSGYWCSLFSAGHLGWFQWMTYGVFAFGLIDRALVKGKWRHWILLGACLAWGSMYQPDLWLLFSVFTAIYFIYRTIVCARARRTDPKTVGTAPQKSFWTRWIAGGAAALAVFVAIGFPSFKSAIVHDLAGRDKQIESGETLSADAAKDDDARWIFVTNWSLPPEDTAEFFVPRIHGDTSCPITLALGSRVTGVTPYWGRLGRPLNAPSGNYRQHSLYVGRVTILLAILAVVLAVVRRKKVGAGRQETRDVVFFAVAAVVFWLFSMGRFCAPVYRLVYALPMGDYLRAPVKWHHLTEFCLCVLAGYGLAALGRLLAEKTKLSVRVISAALGLVVLIGACDLARIDRLYCAPQPVRADVQLAHAHLIDTPQGRAYLKQNNIRVLGRWQQIAALGLPRRPEEPLPADALSSRPVAATSVLSAAGTLLVLAFLVLAVAAPRRFDR
ncbi:MAG: hypothetical protein IJ173_05920 [Kiritimatiellae bacterium]|nr:hypothetical protein [Kiritimatiellia bacterium]